VARDYYEVLGVPRTATPEEIQRAYRTLARRNHPDVNADPAAEERFKEINEAYHILSDPQARTRYDSGVFAQGSRGGGFRSGRGGGAVDLEELFGDLFGGGMGTAGGGGLSGADQEAELALSLEEAYRGGRRTIGLGDREYDVTIPAGVVDGQRIRLAGQGGRARGNGQPGDLYLVVRIRPHSRYRLERRTVTVDLRVAPWEAVLGARVPTDTPGGEETVQVPPGTSSGRRLRLRGRGMPNPRGTPGDLFAEVKIVVPSTVDGRERELYEELSRVSTFDPRGRSDR
jgi:curved DNA-binding protein